VIDRSLVARGFKYFVVHERLSCQNRFVVFYALHPVAVLSRECVMAGAIVSRAAAIYGLENALDVGERHEPAGAFRES
jgi:hypothetical protein